MSLATEIDAQLQSFYFLDKQELIEGVTTVLGDDIEAVVDTHNTPTVNFIFTTSSGSHFMKVGTAEDDAMRAEAAWYIDLPPEQEYTPPVQGISIRDGYSFVLMDFLPNVDTLDDHLLVHRPILSVIQDGITRAKAIDLELFNSHKRGTLNDAASNSLYWNKFISRRREAAKFTYLDNFMTRDTIVINDVEYPGIDAAVNRIFADEGTLDYLLPRHVGKIHGDLHAGNILVPRDRARACVVDPNGSRSLPLEYDLGKLLHSVHGLYGFVMAGRYELNRLAGSRESYQFDIATSRQLVGLPDLVIDGLSDRIATSSLFNEAMHFATMLPHHAAERQETLALGMQAVRLLASLEERL